LSTTADQPRRPAFAWFVLAACVVYAVAISLSVAIRFKSNGLVKAPGWTVRSGRDGWFVGEVDRDGPAAGRLERGDRLLAINGDRRSAVLGVAYWRHVPGGERYRVDVERRGAPVSVDLALPLLPVAAADGFFLLYGLAFFACGAALGLARPDDRQVRLITLCMMLLGFSSSVALTVGSVRGNLVGWQPLFYVVLLATSPWVYPTAYHVFAGFPSGADPGRWWRALQWLLYALCLFVFWPAWIFHYLGVDAAPRVTQFLVDHPTLYLTADRVNTGLGWGYFIACLVLAMVVTARNYGRQPDPDSRRRIRLVVAALMTALIPFAAVTFAYRIAGVLGEATYRNYAGSIAWAPMILIPASLVTAVWKEQLFDIRVIVRRGLQYLFARTALRALLAVPIVLLGLSIVLHPDRTVAQILTQGAGWLNIVWIGAIAAALPARQRLQTSLDRRFFREAYQQEQVLVQLIDEVRQRDSLADIARLVSARIDSVLHPMTLHIFYRAEERSERFERHSSSDVLAPQLSDQHALLGVIGEANSIREFPADLEDRLPEGERAWLERLGVRLIVPITGARERLVGVLLLGVRKSDEPYSSTDKHLLQGIAAQIGLVYENQHLQERVRKDADVRRDVLARLDDRSISLLKECPACGACYDSTVERCANDNAELALTLPIERTLDGKYRLDRAIGRGGFGAVFEAADLRLQRTVAAKVMMGSLFGDPSALRRFEREARSAAKIDHPAITRVHDYGTVGSGGAYLIMELVAGCTWRVELQRSGLIAPARASAWFRQLLDGLQFAHAKGIVHRDLKPENVMIIESPGGDALKIMDFGLAKVLDTGAGATETVTVGGVAMGTLGYMAPEVLMAQAVDERADLFAVGVMAVETIVGVRPCGGRTAQEALTALLQSDYHLPGDSPEMRALDAVVQRCLAKDPRDRYGSAAEVASELVPMLARCPQPQAAAPPFTAPESPTRR
jgi:eukaryotic-like serine/threonine-protein kinase